MMEEDKVSELDYNTQWVLFQCVCGLRTSKTRLAIKHLREEHKLELSNEPINSKFHGNYRCECKNRFTSNQTTIIYQFNKIHKFSMKCGLCDSSCRPIIKLFNKPVNDNILMLACRWRSTMKKIPKIRKNTNYKRTPDHKQDLCEACAIGLCQSNKLYNDNPNTGNEIKNFINEKHQVIELQNSFEVLSVDESIYSTS